MHHAILWCAALLAPHWRRREWLAEWKSELWYVLQNGAQPKESLTFCMGSFRDALWIRRNCDQRDTRQRNLLHAPVRCLALLAVAAAATGALFVGVVGNPKPELTAQFVGPYLLLIGIACVVLPATAVLGLGEYPARMGSLVRAMRWRRWLFLGVKFILILPAVPCGVHALSPVIGANGLLPQLMLIGYILAFRWALDDQRNRCPVCLRLLTSPTTIGQPANTLLDWYGTELCCNKGHGLLHVPGIRSSYSAQTWMELDGSWKSLFS
jgi:hypothetical protein